MASPHDYLNDQAFPHQQGHPYSASYVQAPTGTPASVQWAIGLFVLSFVIFFTLGMYSSTMWAVSMITGIVANLVSIKGAIDARGSALSIIVMVVSSIPALLSVLFLSIAFFAMLGRNF